MLHRRHFLTGIVTAAIASSMRASAVTAQQTQLSALLDSFMDENLNLSPETATNLGLDNGERADAKSRLDERSLTARDREKAKTLDQLRRLGSIDRGALRALDVINHDAVDYSLQV